MPRPGAQNQKGYKMGREIRAVKKGWEHPKKENGSFQPMYDECFDEACESWYADCIKNGGKYTDGEGEKHWWHEWEGDPPDREYYREEKWTKEEAVCIQMYETVSEGTPVSPVFETEEEMINYLCEHGDYWDQQRRKDGNTFMNCQPWTRENAKVFVKSGFALSGIMVNGKNAWAI